MKTILILLLIGISVICQGQNPVIVHHSKQLDSIIFARSLQKVQYKNRFDKEFKKADSAFDYRNSKIYVSDRLGLATLNPTEYFTVGNGCNKTKVSVTKDLVVTIHIDGFSVTDTVWIQAGKRKVGIPAYKMLEYFKDEPIKLSGTLFYNNNYPVLNPK